MRRGVAAIVVGVVLGLGLGRALEQCAVRVDLGPVTRVDPAIRALDAGRRDR